MFSKSLNKLSNYIYIYIYEKVFHKNIYVYYCGEILSTHILFFLKKNIFIQMILLD